MTYVTLPHRQEEGQVAQVMRGEWYTFSSFKVGFRDADEPHYWWRAGLGGRDPGLVVE